MKKKLLTSAFLLFAVIFSGISMNLSAGYKQITSSITDGGTINPAGVMDVSIGSSQTYTFAPASCYKVASVEIDGIPVADADWAGNTYTFLNVQNPHTIKVVCEFLMYTLSPSCGDNGSISPDQDAIVACNSRQEVTFTPDAGYVVDEVVLNGTRIVPTPTSPYSFTVNNDPTTIRVTFKLDEPSEYTITPTAGPNGTITPNTVVTVSAGGSQTFTITANTNYVVDTIIVTGVTSGNADTAVLYSQKLTSYSRPVTNVQENTTIRVTFEFNTGIYEDNIPELSVFPNPTTGKVLIERGDVEISKIEVISSDGKVVMAIDNPDVTIELSNLLKGSYFLRFHTTKGLGYRQIIKN